MNRNFQHQPAVTFLLRVLVVIAIQIRFTQQMSGQVNQAPCIHSIIQANRQSSEHYHQQISKNIESSPYKLYSMQEKQYQASTCVIASNNNQQKINMGNCQNQLYYVVLGVGTPPQYFNLQLDTGSNILWLPTILASSAGFNAANSSSFQNLSTPYQIQYVNGGLVNGTFGNDFVTLTNTSINVTMQILFADQVQGLSLPNGIVGIVGFGYPNSNFLDLAYQNGQITTNSFSLSLQNIFSPSSPNSTLYYNQPQNKIIEQSSFSQVVDTFYWEIGLTQVFADTMDLTQYAANVAVIDSGTSLFYLNPPLAQKINSTYLPSYLCNFTNGLNICNISIISSLPNLTFLFNKYGVKLTPQDYTQCFGTVCYVHIYTIDTNPPQVLLGDTLFMKYNITFNKRQETIGFQGDLVYAGLVYSSGFLISQYVLFGFCIVFFIVALILAILFTKESRQLQANLQPKQRQRVTQLEVVGKF